VYLPGTSRTGPAQSAPLLRPLRRRRLGAPPAPGPDCKAPSAQHRPGSVQTCCRSTGASMAVLHGLQVLDENLPETGHGRNVDVIITRPGHPVPPATKATQAVCDHARPCQDVRHPGVENHLAEPDETARGPRHADTQSGCQFASPRASPYAFLLRLVSLAPLFTLADACLTLPMGSQTDTSRRGIERFPARGGRAECGAAPQSLSGDDVVSAQVTTHCRLPRISGSASAGANRNRHRGRHRA
jgi:hypothetical protein